MRLNIFVSAVLPLILFAVSSAQNSFIVPTTTLAALTSNNTSTADAFSSQSNGNRGAGNVSKLDIHSLLYSGATTKIFAHMLLWFGQSNHMNIGYSSVDRAQVRRQINDMISRGIDGVVIDWYGPNNFIDQATQFVMKEAERHRGFTFAIMIDQGAIAWDSCSGCTPQQALISQLQYIENTYFSSPAYLTHQGQPIITNFNVTSGYPIDWNAVNASLTTHPLFLFQDSNGFSQPLSAGSYSWVMPVTDDLGMGYLTGFYDAGMNFPAEQTVGAAYKGFNDTLASWGSNRIMNQQCGGTWLQTFAKVNSLYSAARPIPFLQLVTWNDYEEATEIESGIDNCFSVSASTSNNGLSWNISGDENTISQYNVYISTDGNKLMLLTSMAPGSRSLDLCSFSMPAENYQLFVQALGKPAFANQMSASVSYAPSCSNGNSGGSPSVSFIATPPALTMNPGQSGSFDLVAKTESGDFSQPISLSCAGLPAALSCSFSPSALTPGSGSASSTVTISPVSIARLGSRDFSWKSFYAAVLFLFGIPGLALIGSLQRGRPFSVRSRVVLGLLALSLCAVACGGGPKTSAGSQDSQGIPVTYSVTLSGVSTSAQFSTVVTVTVP